MIIETRSPEESFELGKKIGEAAKPGQVYTLNGDLGVGKTVFTQGVAAGLGITEPVSSPTFTIVQVYEEGGRGDIIEVKQFGHTQSAELQAVPTTPCKCRARIK